jgi:hypothetical protein
MGATGKKEQSSSVLEAFAFKLEHQAERLRVCLDEMASLSKDEVNVSNFGMAETGLIHVDNFVDKVVKSLKLTTSDVELRIRQQNDTQLGVGEQKRPATSTKNNNSSKRAK